jgi:hypothetical protein
MALLYLSFSTGDGFSRSSSCTPTLTYWESTNSRKTCALWSHPDTRAKLLQGLAEKCFGREQVAEMQKIIDVEKSDLFDVLAHVAYALPPLTREESLPLYSRVPRPICDAFLAPSCWSCWRRVAVSPPQS